MRIIVGTSVAKYHRWPGYIDLRLTYATGLQQLGHQVFLFDDVRPTQVYGLDHQPVEFSNWDALAGFQALTQDYGVWPNCCLIYDGGPQTFGLSFAKAQEVAASADVLINGKLKTPEIIERVPHRVYVDEAPAHTQVYEEVYKVDQGIGMHHAFFSFGLNIGTERCEIPTCGKEWKPFYAPVDTSQWQVAPVRGEGRFTTVSNWEGEATFDYKGEFSGEKVENWWKFIDLPNLTDQALEVALNISPVYRQDINKFESHGWILTDPLKLRTRMDYQNYIASSKAEFSIANNRYSYFRTGWFSDRSARYLASGRPVLVQSTGIEGRIPTGQGLLTFQTIEEAIEGIDDINRNYETHARAARQIAETYFDSRRVLSAILDH